MARSENTGIRIVHFKDFCFEPSSSSPPYVFWEQVHSFSTWLTVAKTSPAIDRFSTGNKYGASGGSSPGRVGVLRSISTNLWCNTDQDPYDNRNGINYDIALNSVTGGIGGLLFMWDGSTTGSCYALHFDGSTLSLYKVTGDPSYIANYTLLNIIASGLSTNTEYWIRILYYPADVYFHGKSVSSAGTFRIWVDTSRLSTGTGEVATLTYTDPSPITSGGDYLGLFHVSTTGQMEYDGITFADEFLPALHGFFHQARLMLKGVSTLEARFTNIPEMPPVEKNQRVELWINNMNDQGKHQYRLPEFDGVIKLKTLTEREKVIKITCFDETYELTRSGSNKKVDQSSYTNYYNYIRNALFGEYFGWRGKNSRIHTSGIPSLSGYESYNISEDWEYDITDFDMVNIISVFASVICAWNPEGFFLARKGGFATGMTIDIDQTSPGPAPVLWYHVNESLIDFVNSVKVYNKDTNVHQAEDTSSQDKYGVNEEKFIMTPLPSTEANSFAEEYLRMMEDENPFLELVCLSYLNELFPGCTVKVSSSKLGWVETPMIVVEKFVSSGDWEQRTQHDVPPGATFLRLAYYDPDASPHRLPRVYYPTHEERTAHEINKAKKQEQSMTQNALSTASNNVIHFNEQPAGVIDGSNVTFTLSNDVNASNAIVSVNGVVQIPIAHYSINGKTLTFTTAPTAGDVILVTYEEA